MSTQASTLKDRLLKSSKEIQQSNNGTKDTSLIKATYQDSQDSNLLQSEKIQKLQYDVLTSKHIWAYGVGHFLNDLCAAMWFNFLSLYLNKVNQIDSSNPGYYSGLVLLCGQMADGLATPLIGTYSDKFDTRFGKRKPWYIAGMITVTICFLFIFQECVFCEIFGDSLALRVVYYCLFPSLFNVGWASLQISHMSLVPSLTNSRKRRDKLNNLRNSFTYTANFLVLIIALIIFGIFSSTSPKTQYEVIAYIVVSIGFITSLFFVFSIDEPYLSRESQRFGNLIKQSLSQIERENEQSNLIDNTQKDLMNHGDQHQLVIEEEHSHEKLLDPKKSSKRNYRYKSGQASFNSLLQTNANKNQEQEQQHWSTWLKDLSFYQYGIAYMSVRIVNNISMSILNFYIIYTIIISTEKIEERTPYEVALVPLTMFISSVIASLFQEKLYEKMGRKKSLTFAFILVTSASICMIFLNQEYNYLVYPVVVVTGVGQAFFLNTGIAYISEVVGQKAESGAFVFGFYSLLDKISNGLLLFFIMKSESFENNDPEFIRWVMVLVPFSAGFLAWIMILTGKAQDYQSNNKNSNNQLNEFEDFVI